MKLSTLHNFFSRWSRNKLTHPEDDGQNLVDDAVLYTQEKVRDECLKQLIKQSEFHGLDRLNEYDEDYTFFETRGALLTREMERALLRQQQVKTHERPSNLPSGPDETHGAGAGNNEGNDAEKMNPDDDSSVRL